jgi:hypothetical protein
MTDARRLILKTTDDPSKIPPPPPDAKRFIFQSEYSVGRKTDASPEPKVLAVRIVCTIRSASNTKKGASKGMSS